MTEQTFLLAVIIGIMGASCSLGFAIGAREVGASIRATELHLKIGDVMQIQISNTRGR